MVNIELDKNYIEGVEFIIECNNFESMVLREKHKEHLKFENTSVIKHLGALADMPLWMSLTIGRYKNVKFVSYEPTSLVVDHRTIRDFFDYHHFDTPSIDASNFQRVINLSDSTTEEGK